MAERARQIAPGILWNITSMIWKGQETKNWYLPGDPQMVHVGDQDDKLVFLHLCSFQL